MKPILPILLGFVVAFGRTDAAESSVKGRTLTDINVVPTRVLQNSVSPKFYKSLLVSPLEGLITVRGQISGARIVGAKVIRSELSGLFDPLAMQLAKEAEIAGNFTLDRPNIPASVLLHCLVYKIADGTMVLSFAHFDGPRRRPNEILRLRPSPRPQEQQVDGDCRAGQPAPQGLGRPAGLEERHQELNEVGKRSPSRRSDEHERHQPRSVSVQTKAAEPRKRSPYFAPIRR